MSLEPGEAFWTLRDTKSGATRRTSLSVSTPIGVALEELQPREPRDLVVVRCLG